MYENLAQNKSPKFSYKNDNFKGLIRAYIRLTKKFAHRVDYEKFSNDFPMKFSLENSSHFLLIFTLIFHDNFRVFWGGISSDISPFDEVRILDGIPENFNGKLNKNFTEFLQINSTISAIILQTNPSNFLINFPKVL